MISQKRLNIYISQINQMIRIGIQMSNICYNLSQRERIDENDQNSMQKCYKEWDAIFKKTIDGVDTILDDYEAIRALNKSKQKKSRKATKP